MARQIQVNDLVLVTQLGFATSTYIIRQIDQNGIYVSLDTNPNALSLVVSDQIVGWKISGSNILYTIQFQANPNLIVQHISPTSPVQHQITISGNKNIDFVILSQLDDNSLYNACLTNKYTALLCRDDELWRHKVIYRFSGAEKFKGKEKQWRKYYEELATSGGDVNDAAENGHLDVLKWLYAHANILPEDIGANEAVRNEHLDVLEWLAQHNIFPDIRGYNLAAEKGHLDVLKWLAQYKFLPDYKGANNAAKNGHLDVLKWLYEQHNILPNKNGADSTAENGYLNVLVWLDQHNILPSVSGANWAAMKGHLDILDWLEHKNILPNVRGANFAKERGKYEVTTWLAQRGIYSS